MIVLRSKNFSNKGMINRISNKLDKDGIEDYDIVSKIDKDYINITTDLNDLCIYIPTDLEYVQYDIDDYIRSLAPYVRTTTTLDRNVYVMKLASGKLTEDQYYKLVRYIITENEFCALIDN